MFKVILTLLIILFSTGIEAKNKKQTSAPQIPPPSYALWNVNTNTYITGRNDGEIRPVASITKLMSVLVTMQENLDLDEELVVRGSEKSNKIRNGMRIARGKLIELALISSDNLATRTLAENFPGGYTNFLDKMNYTAQQLNMENTRYEDATGLLGGNISSADDIRKLVLAVTPFSIITNAANTVKLAFTTTVVNKNKPKEIKIEGFNTNRYAGKLDIIAAKTGYTSRAGRCLTMLFNHGGTQYLLVVMGAQTPKQRQEMVDYLLTQI